MQKKVLLAFSGGLDTSFCAAYLKEQGYEVFTLTVDTGGFDKKGEVERIKIQAKALGVKKHYFIDAKKDLFDNFISYIIKGNILKGHIYPLCAGTERLVIAQKLAELARKIDVKYVAHGSTGAGNDQIRFDVALKVLGADLIVLTPIRELSISREKEVEFLKKNGVIVSSQSKSYSINQGLLGVTIGGKETKGSWQSPPDSIYPGIKPIEKTPNNPIELTISFNQGLPVAIDGKKMSGVRIMLYLAKIGGEYGIGKNIHLGSTIIGIKGRVAFAAPAAMILINAHRELEKLVQTKWQSFWKEVLSDFYGGLLHEALYFDPVMRDIEAMIDSNQQYVTGDVKVKLFKGNIIIAGSKSLYSLMDSKVATYGEESKLWDENDVMGFSKIYSIQSVLASNILNKGKKLYEKD